jgi:hypothetical protein
MAQTKVKLISDGVIVQSNLHSSHGITTAHIGEGSNLYYTDARVDTRVGNLNTGNLPEGSNLYYTDARADARVALIVDSSPATLNTLNELAAALGDDPNFATTTANSIGTKLPLAGGTLTGALQAQPWLFRQMSSQVEYHVLDNGNLNGPSWKFRYDGATSNRYVDFGFKDGAGNYVSGLKLHNNSTVSWRGADIINANAQWVGDINTSVDIQTGAIEASGDVTISKTGNAALTITGGTTNTAKINFGDSSNDDAGIIEYTNDAGGSDNMKFTVGTIEQMRLANSLLTFPSTGVSEVRVDIGSNKFAIGNMGDASSQMMVSSRGFLTFNVSNTGSAKDATERMRIGSNGLVSLPTTGLNDTRHIIFTGTQGVANNAGNLGMWGNEVRLTGNWYYNGAQRKVVAGNGMGVMGIGVGTTDAACYLTFGVNGPAATGGPTERMRISSSGNVGIGFAPGHNAITPLELPGSTINSSLKAGTLEMQSYSVNNSWLADNVYYNGGWYLRNTGYASQVYFGSGGDISFKRFATGNAGTVATPVLTMQLDSAGNVGIGKSQSGNAVLTARSAAGGNTGMILIEGDTTDDGWGVYATTSNKYIITRFTAGSYSDKFTILESGNVGIGTDSPSAKLHVQTSAVAGLSHTYYGSLIVENSGECAIDIVGTSYSSIYFGDAASPYAGGIVYNHSLNALDFRTNTNTNAMWIDSGGDVGIGITSPGEKLEVNGNIKAGDTTGKFFTNVYTATTASFADTFSSSGPGLWEYIIKMNPNPAGSGSYTDFYYGKFGVGTGWNGSGVTDNIWYQEDQTAPRTLYSSGGGNKTISFVMVSGGSEVTSVSHGTTVTIRVKGFGGNSYNQNISIFFRRLA